jgi:hypothetical protein
LLRANLILLTKPTGLRRLLRSVDRTVQELVDVIFPDLDALDAVSEREFLLKRSMPVPQSVLDKIAAAQAQQQASSGATSASLAAPPPLDSPRQRVDKPKIRYNDEVTFHLLADRDW